MRVRNLVLAMLFLAVIAPIVLYTDRLTTFKTYPSAEGEFVEDVTSVTLKGRHNQLLLNLLHQEPSTSIKAPTGIVFSDNLTKSLPISVASAQQRSTETALSTELESQSTEHKSISVLASILIENPIGEVPDTSTERTDPIKQKDQTVLSDDRLRAMEQTLAKGKQIQDDCSAAVKKLRAILHATEEQLRVHKKQTMKLRAILHSTKEQLRVHKKQTMFLTQLIAKMLPKGLHCLPLRLTAEYFASNSSQCQFQNKERLEDPQLYHYALFSDNVLAAAVVVNSTVIHAKDASKHVFHIVSDGLNYAATRMWFLVNPPGNATVQVQNIEEFTWLNSSYCPVLKQLRSPSMIDYYFRAHPANSDMNLKYRNPKYLSILNHLRFYLPEIFPKLNKVLFLDDDVVVQRDLTDLWSLDLKGNVNGAVETCGESFHRFDRYLNFSNPLISKNFDPRACGWAYGMNIFDLEEWKRQNITVVYHAWQKLNFDRQLWKLGTLPPGLITFWKRTYPLARFWHVLGLGYNPSVNQKEIERAAVIHYNGNMKPWLEISMPKYRNYWTKYVDYDHIYLRDCNINP